jgi:hypothetical protein
VAQEEDVQVCQIDRVKKDQTSRTTSLGEFSLFGRLFMLASLIKITEAGQNFGNFFS